MYQTLFKLICIFNLLILIYAAEHDVTNEKYNHPYDINRVNRRISSTLTFKDKFPVLANDFIFNKLDRDFSIGSLEDLSQNSSKCLKDILFTFQSLSNVSDMWAWRLLDSFAKPPDSGFLQGNYKWVGEYNECIDVHAPPKSPSSTTGNFNGQYCTMTYTLSLFNTSIPLSFGICLPDSCSPNDLQAEIIQILFRAGGYPVLNETSPVSNHSVSVSCVQKKDHLTIAAISVIVLLSIFGALTLMGSAVTAVKYFKKVFREHKKTSLVVNVSGEEQVINDPDYKSKDSVSDDISLLTSEASNGFLDKCEAFLTCFCLFTNGAKLLNTDSSEGQLLCIHGIRFLSMSWVVLGHVYIFGILEIRNMGEIVNLLDDFAFQAILQGFFSVDSFFVLSGFLLSYLSMKEFSKTKGSINWPYFYIHRYLRLTPIYMIVLGFSASVYLYLGSGPFWPKTDYDANCQNSWWWNLLYINNFIKQSEMCMGWSWYLANDMQFFVISPIFLISLWRWPKIGYSLLGLFLTACIFSNFYLTYHFDMVVGMVGLFGFESSKDTLQIMMKYTDFFEKIYVKPYTRIGPYLIGIITGYILFKYKSCNKPKLSWVYLSIGWVVASSVTLTCVYGMYHANPSLIARSFYNGLNRTLFGCGLSWVIYVCLTDQSNIINSILSFKLFIPLSRLTYAAYLIHPLIVTGYYSNLKIPFEFSHPTLVILFLGFMVVTYGLALPVSLILESPIVSLEKLIRKKYTRN